MSLAKAAGKVLFGWGIVAGTASVMNGSVASLILAALMIGVGAGLDSASD